MCTHDPKADLRHGLKATPGPIGKPQPVNAAAPQDRLSPVSLSDDLLDVFSLDEDTAEPEPDEGDFWGRLDDEEET